MDKSKLVKFINKYYLSGNVNSVVVNSDGNGLNTRFVSSDKSLLGEVKLKNYSLTEAEFGVYTTDVLLKMLSVLDENISVELTSARIVLTIVSTCFVSEVIVNGTFATSVTVFTAPAPAEKKPANNARTSVISVIKSFISLEKFSLA